MRPSFFVTLPFAISCGASAAPVERVISLAPHATEIAFSAGLGNKLIAVSERSDYPEQAKNIEKVSNYQGIKIERIIALQPDLIIAWPSGNPIGELKKLEQFGFEIYYSQTNSLEDIAHNIEQLSEYSDTPSVGKQAASDFRQTLQDLKAKYHTEIPVRYFYQLSEQPIITLAKGKWPSEVFSFCGGENIFEHSSAPYPQVGMEQVIIQNPDVIFTSQHAIENGEMWQKWHDQLAAVQNNHMWTLNSDWINRPTPRTLKAIEQVCEHFETIREKR
ncbi:vitamin B12 ABC transporter substrate-binding protein BtuF [Vibrio sp. TBV020]|uniref:vitamin B12 ABC transporter substrate-binding protein BtuF n=1 Tax=Vibrio sp. TBV020 TaxID=3137398 RepID=UPI0038CDBAA8